MNSCTTGRYVNTKTGEYFDESKLDLLMAQGPVINGTVLESLTSVPVLTEKYVRRAQGSFPAEQIGRASCRERV